ncbi:MAG: hypothetical protein ABL965_06880, partial [Nitrospira sp.]
VFSWSAAESVSLYQRIQDQTTIDAPMDNGFGCKFRSLFFDHQTFALLTIHQCVLLLLLINPRASV